LVLKLSKIDAVFTPVVVVAAIETERYPLMATLLASSVLGAVEAGIVWSCVTVPVEATGAWVAGVSATVDGLELPPPPHADNIAMVVSATRANESLIFFITQLIEN